MLFELLPQIIFGWPFMIAAVLLSIAGVAMKRYQFLVAGGLFLMPPSLYLSGYPGLRWSALLLPFFLLGAAYLVRKGRSGIAWILLLPPVLLIGWLAFIVMAQARSMSGV